MPGFYFDLCLISNSHCFMRGILMYSCAMSWAASILSSVHRLWFTDAPSKSHKLAL